MMPSSMVLLLLVLAVSAEPPKAEPAAAPPPLALLLTLEVEDMDRDIGHQRETVASSRQKASAMQKLGARGSASLDEQEQEAADARYQEARLGEMIAVRDLKAHQRDVHSGTTPADESREFDLVLAVLTAQESTARVEADFRAYRQRQAQSLLRRNAVSREYKDNVDADAENAQVGLAILRVRRARLARESALRSRLGDRDPAGMSRREVELLRATLDHDRHVAALARARAAVVVDRLRGAATGSAPSSSSSDLETLKAAIDSAEAAVIADEKALARAQAPPPSPTPAP